MFASLIGNDPEKMQGVHVFGFEEQDVPVPRLRLLEPSLPMMLKGDLQY
jgi:hypothetical protein